MSAAVALVFPCEAKVMVGDSTLAINCRRHASCECSLCLVKLCKADSVICCSHVFCGMCVQDHWRGSSCGGEKFQKEITDQVGEPTGAVDAN